MALNNSETNMSSVNKKRNDPDVGYVKVPAEIGFPNNKDKGEGRKGGIVGKG
jgi:murein L,D-transpeptidase YafK